MNARIEFMKRLIGAAERLAPNRVPNGDDDMLRIWSEVIPLERYPERVWIDAVVRWGKCEGEFLEVGTLERHAKAIVREWEGIPSKRQVIEAHRNARLKARESAGELPPGTTFSGQQAQTGRVSGPTEAQRKAIRDAVNRAREKRLAQQGHIKTPQEALASLDKLVEHYANQQPKEA